MARNDDGRRRGRVLASVGAAAALTLGAVAVAAFPTVASAGVQTSAVATGVCDVVDEVGLIQVEIIDSSSQTYDVFIDEELVAEGITDTDGLVAEFGPYDDGDHRVVVTWIEGEEDILDTIVELDCNTAPADSTTSSAPAVAAAAATAPSFTG